MQYQIGDIVDLDNSKIVSYMTHANKQESYLVVGVDDNDGCPCIGHEGQILYLYKDELAHIKLRTRRNRESFLGVEREYFYVPPNKEIEELIIRLEYQNLLRGGMTNR